MFLSTHSSGAHTVLPLISCSNVIFQFWMVRWRGSFNVWNANQGWGISTGQGFSAVVAHVSPLLSSCTNATQIHLARKKLLAPLFSALGFHVNNWLDILNYCFFDVRLLQYSYFLQLQGLMLQQWHISGLFLHGTVLPACKIGVAIPLSLGMTLLLNS